MTEPTCHYVHIACECGARLHIIPTEPDGYRVQHGDNPEAVSPHLRGEERSFAWRTQVHARMAQRDD